MENNTFASNNSIQSLNGYFNQNFDNLIKNIITVTEIPSPSFEEDKKGDFIINFLKEFQNLEVLKDDYKNVIVRYPGQNKISKLAILTHIDTVFPMETELKVTKTDKYLIGPGVGDNSASVAVSLQIILSWCSTNFKPEFDILFVFNACEEGLGDLKGVKGFLDGYCSKSENKVDLKALLAIDGTIDRVTHIGTGVKRYKIEVTTRGGHSWANFGEYSAIHIIGNIISDFSKTQVPEVPKTTYNIGFVEGGTSVNTIADRASILVDLRSMSQKELSRLDDILNTTIEIQTKGRKDVNVKVEVVGDRPSGRLPVDHPLVNITKESAVESELETVPISGVASTDANIPLSRNIPAIAFGCYIGSGAHTKTETIDIQSLVKGVPFANLVILKTIHWLKD